MQFKFMILLILTIFCAGFLNWNNPPSIFGTVLYHFLGISRSEFKVIQSSLPGCILVTKAYHIRFQQDMGLIIPLIVSGYKCYGGVLFE